jgi:hypothetical protein
MPYSILYGISVAQIRDDFASAKEAVERLEALRRGNAVGIILLDEKGAEISNAHLNALAKIEDGDRQEYGRS